jgi:hypothetical protein
MDKLVGIKGLVIRTTPTIPDMKEGELVAISSLFGLLTLF